MRKRPTLALNGFGRIGRAIAKLNLIHKRFELVLINDLNQNVENLAYLFKYDSTYGRFEGEIDTSTDRIILEGSPVTVSSRQTIIDLPIPKSGIDILIDASGVSSNVIAGKELLSDGRLGKMIVTHSHPDVDREIVMGVNESKITNTDRVFSSSICDANAISHVLKWMNDEYHISGGALTTLHPWLSYQNLVDGPSISQSHPGISWSDFALGRAAVSSIIPKNTTALTAVEKILPEISGRLMSFSYRIPTGVVASSDLTLNIDTAATDQEIREFLQTQVTKSSYVEANNDSLVSIDYEKSEASAIVDFQWLKVSGKTIKIVLWYDNEWGYSARVLDLAELVSQPL
jgi:glyceraldehyde 3-phosphate dehydrogenase